MRISDWSSDVGSSDLRFATYFVEDTMLRFVPLAAAVATSAMLLGATAGHAVQSRGYYVATALEAPAKANFVPRSTAWSSDGAVCTAHRSTERDAFVLERVPGSDCALTAFLAGRR